MYFAKFIKAFLKPRNLNTSRNKLHFLNLQIMCFNKMIYNMFMFCDLIEHKHGLNFDNFAKIAHKIAKSNYCCPYLK